MYNRSNKRQAVSVESDNLKQTLSTKTLPHCKAISMELCAMGESTVRVERRGHGPPSNGQLHTRLRTHAHALTHTHAHKHNSHAHKCAHTPLGDGEDEDGRIEELGLGVGLSESTVGSATAECDGAHRKQIDICIWHLCQPNKYWTINSAQSGI